MAQAIHPWTARRRLPRSHDLAERGGSRLSIRFFTGVLRTSADHLLTARRSEWPALAMPTSTLALYLTRYLNVPPARIAGEDGELLDDLPADPEIRAALLDAWPSSNLFTRSLRPRLN